MNRMELENYAAKMAQKLVQGSEYYKEKREASEAERICIAFAELAKATSFTFGSYTSNPIYEHEPDTKPTIHPSELVPEVAGRAGEFEKQERELNIKQTLEDIKAFLLIAALTLGVLAAILDYLS